MAPRTHWVCGVVVALIGVVFVAGVDLRPQVGPDFFFGSNDPSFQDTARILELFPSDAQLILSAAAPDIFAEEYLEQVRTLSDRVTAVDGVLRVMSLSHGPGNAKRAMDSPLWRRMLIADSQTSSLVIAMVDPHAGAALIGEIEMLVDELRTDAFELRMSGMPYIVEMIRRNLVSDLKTFTLAAVVIFGAIIVRVFRSTKILIGTLVACLSAIMLTLLAQSWLGAAVGPLTANLSTIVFVLTQSHIIFLTANWQRLQGAATGATEAADGEDLVPAAVRRTFTASFWCMITTLLGFVSLLFVEAKPLRELGLGGSIGTLMAIACAYLVYPPFMRWAQATRLAAAPPVGPAPPPAPALAPTFRRPPRRPVLIAAAVLALGLLRVNTDPSLLAYFAPGSELREGLEFIDRNGGSSPLQMVVGMPDDARLDNDDGYERMWGLQGALSAHESVGTVVSLPVLMAEGHRRRGASILSWSKLLNVMSWRMFDNVAANFVTPDRTQAMYLLRMTEAGRTRDRAAIIGELTDLVTTQGLELRLLGGIYVLQAHMARLVASSLITGLGALLVLFAGVAYVVSRSFRVSAAMAASVAVIPVVMFGCIGLFGVPVDIISAPAGNVAIGIGVDAMIHLALAVRLRAQGRAPGAADWRAALQEQRRPTLIAAGIVAAGFAIFALSGFPPTRRFGVGIVLGAAVAAVATLRVFPLLGGAMTPDAEAVPELRAVPESPGETTAALTSA